MSRAAIEFAWTSAPDGFKLLTREYGRHVEESTFKFSFCDVIANFFERAVVATGDPDVLTSAIKALVALGHSHNRWHVQGVVTRLLQDVRDAPTALAASEALRDCDPAAVEWTISDFAGRSLHPALRRTIDSICNRSKPRTE
jgi:eukaryotic-like serine/threonine-protein kinase